MWCLHAINGKRKICLLTGKEYTIGRKDADIVISDDSSVSRKHGTIGIEANADYSAFVVTVKDTSKFGIFYARNAGSNFSTEEYVQVNSSCELKDGDIIRIGMQHTVFKLIKQKMIVITSMMDVPSQTRLRGLVSKLGGIIINSWQSNLDVTHLVMDKIILNVKVTQALANSSHVVTEHFFDKCIQAITENKNFPSEENFLPPLGEDSLDKKECSFLCNIQRKSLFKSRMFIFLNMKQFKRLRLTCCFAGGAATLISDLKFDDLEKIISRPGTAVISQANVPKVQLISEKQFLRLQELLINAKQRLIQEHEIGLSLLYCCCDVYTNPKFDLTSENMFTQHTIHGGTLSQSAANVDSVHLSGIKKSNTPSQSDRAFVSRVPETIGIDTLCSDNSEIFESSSLKKRLHTETANFSPDAEKPPAKFPKLDKTSADEVVEDLLHGFASAKVKQQKVKPAPKRKVGLSKKVTVDEVKSEKSYLTAKQGAEEDNKVSLLPDSCIDDDSLWSSKSLADIGSIIKCESDFQVDFKRTSVCTVKSEASNQTDKNHITSSKQSATVGQISGHSSANQVGHLQTVPNSTSSLQNNHSVLDISSLAEDYDQLETNLDPNQPFHDLANIVKTSLIVKCTSSRNYQYCGVLPTVDKKVKNCKRFQKIFPLYKNSGSQTNVHSFEAPRIIGGRDLKLHVNRIDSNAGFNDWEDINCRVHESQESNPFDNLLMKKTARKRF